MFTKLLDANEDAILIDEYGNPCKVDPVLLHNEAKLRYQEQMNAWHVEFEELQKQR